MKTINEEMFCHECGELMIRDIRKRTITYKNHSIIVDQPGWYCDDCDEGILCSADIEVTEKDFFKLKNKIDGVDFFSNENPEIFKGLE